MTYEIDRDESPDDVQDGTLLMGECFDDSATGRHNWLFVNLYQYDASPTEYWVLVYTSDDGGPVDYWVEQGFTDRTAAVERYNGRLIEARENTPNYVANVYGCDAEHRAALMNDPPDHE